MKSYQWERVLGLLMVVAIIGSVIGVLNADDWAVRGLSLMIAAYWVSELIGWYRKRLWVRSRTI